jgi:RNA polymerase sigma factor (sigma-70 family)
LEYLARLEKEDAIVESYESQLEIQTPPKFDTQIEEKENQEIVQNYLSKLLVRLPPLERQILQMHLIDGMSAQEISDSLGMDIYETRYALNCVKAKVRYRYRYMQKI